MQRSADKYLSVFRIITYVYKSYYHNYFKIMDRFKKDPSYTPQDAKLAPKPNTQKPNFSKLLK